VEITKERLGDFLHVRVSGRIDNHWSEPFDEAIEEMIREGAHHLRLDLSAVTYLSSAGIGALMTAYRDTTQLQGSFVITAASERVRTILQLVQRLNFRDELARYRRIRAEDLVRRFDEIRREEQLDVSAAEMLREVYV
jgi:anti-anti-sigma factor